MGNFVSGGVIRALREKKKLTQAQLADIIAVSAKAVSKWETGRGLPDITLIEPLARALGVSIAELLSGECAENRNRSANMLRGCFYACPACGNIIRSIGRGSFSCCGIQLPVLEAEEPDGEHAMSVEKSESDWYVTLRHPMTREHYLSFIAYVTMDRADFRKLYPEQGAEARFAIAGPGVLYAYCNRHGLFRMKI